ncbi:specifically androgen-regulated gene protein [Nelusetta ayraudi]|uniref:specifically androgen-regulated gene protein n=1 Tax=Nelusetta ayraudi TaxID=303726 RepID=UPI003F725251
MPITDTWPGGPGLETMMGMDSAGSCDSVVSANSGCSDDSLDHLSAEEKACLLFLEETIESLDTKEDSDLSEDEQDLLFNPGSEERSSKEAPTENFTNELPKTYLDPTTFVLTESLPRAKANFSLKKNSRSQPQPTAPSRQPELTPRQIKLAQEPVYANVIKPPPPLIKPKEFSVKTGETPLPRGPLSYDALVHLRKSASEKMTPLCPRIDHTIDLEKHLPAPVKGPKQESDRSDSQPSLTSMAAPPAVTPRSRKIPAVVPVKTPDQAPVSSDPSHKLKHCSDAKVVRLEALHKLGLLQEQEPQNETVAPLPPLPPPKPKKFLKPTSDKLARGPFNGHPPRSQLFDDSQVATEPKTKLLQSSTSFQHSSRDEQQTVAASHQAEPSKVKPAGPEPSATLDNNAGPAPIPKPRHIPCPHAIQTRSAGQASPNAASNAVGYTVMVVPGMGTDRKEALRKLGLLKT